ncbi:MAG: hypothetical protein EPO68_05610 [Planctomycetota bacterium]|nr:MAG: hypothetical protein EPO68_05610 [Planctomycetota bacterium]
MGRATRCARALAPLALVALASSHAAQNSFSKLAVGQRISDLSADGSVAVGTSGFGHFRWSEAGGIVFLGGYGPEGAANRAKISRDGTRVCGGSVDPTSGQYALSLYTDASGAWTQLAGIGAPCLAEVSSGGAISGDGTSIVGRGWLGCASAHALQWHASTSTSTDLGSSSSGGGSFASGTNLDGSVVVGWEEDALGSRQGAVWVNGVQTLLTDAASGLPLGEARDVSDDGTWVVGVGAIGNGYQAWRWSVATGGQSLGMLPGVFDPRGGATAISADGRIIVGFVHPDGTPEVFAEGFLWREDLGMVGLTNWAIAMGQAVPAATLLSLPRALSDDGSVIAGVARVGGGGAGFVMRMDELVADRWTISRSGGGAQSLALRSAPANAGKLYVLLGSLSGTIPGVSAGSLVLPLVPDAYFAARLNAPNAPPMSGGLGFLDASARASATLTLPAGFDASLLGLVAHQAYAVLDVPGSGALLDVSNAVSLTLVP